MRDVRWQAPVLGGALAWALLCGLPPSAGVSAADSADGQYHDMITPNGYTDWTRGVVVAKGLGVPPKTASNPLQAREMTRTAAWSVALRNLLEAAKGISVDSTTTVNNYITTNDEVRTKVDGMVRGARVVQEKELPDGSFEMTVEMKLGGEFSGTVVPKPTELKTRPLDKLAKLPPPEKQSDDYTGLVIDARGLPAKPAMSPRILTEQGDEAYSIAYVEQSPTAMEGIAVYVSSWPAATKHPRVTTTPMKIKALRVAGKNSTDLIIADTDAQMIHLDPKNFAFLKQAKVLVILDAK